ncbi:unnamed protein product [Arctia plantaginis]|uniref:Uncharacterized protein n=1 Tax=Arctia plantaginis TaxID=874455 RepID=A0A8S0YS17_ARCPL|nr:unnamed protein product [Arctia plantaginis]
MSSRSIQNYISSPLRMRGGFMRKKLYENSMLRKSSSGEEIKVYIITDSSKSKKVKRSDDLDSIRNLFDENGMVYLTKPKTVMKMDLS